MAFLSFIFLITVTTVIPLESRLYYDYLLASVGFGLVTSAGADGRLRQPPGQQRLSTETGNEALSDSLQDGVHLEIDITNDFIGADNNSNIDFQRTVGVPQENTSLPVSLTMTTNGIDTVNISTTERNATKKRSHDALNWNSNLYISIRNSIPLLASDYNIRRRSCKNNCGKTSECSCKPICRVLKTCCVDFLEECGDFFDLTQFQHDFSWLQSVDTQCMSRVVDVSSCSPHEHIWKEEDSHEFYQLSGFSSLGQTSEAVNTNTNALRWADVYKALLPIHQKDESSLDDSEKMMLSTPILDTSTGISYKNISLYSCNGANVSHARLWSAFFPMESTYFPLESELSAVKDIFSLLNFFSPRPFVSYLRDDSFPFNTEQCNTKAIRSCPDDFMDQDVIEACHNINFFLTVSRQNGQSLVEVEYKNPFSLFCNMGVDNKVNNLKIINFLAGSSNNFRKSSGLEFSFDPSGYNKNGILIRQFSPKDAIIPAWHTLSCNFLFRPDDNLNQRTAAKTTTGLSETRINEGQSLQTECQVDGCLAIHTQNMCLQWWIIILVLPPATVNLTDRYLDNSLEIWRQFLVHRFSNDVLLSYILMSIIAVLIARRRIHGNDVIVT